MIIQVSVKHHTAKYIRTEIVPWVEEHFGNDFTHGWPHKRFMFPEGEEAVMFVMKFGGIRTETQIDKMLRNLSEAE